MQFSTFLTKLKKLLFWMITKNHNKKSLILYTACTATIQFHYVHLLPVFLNKYSMFPIILHIVHFTMKSVIVMHISNSLFGLSLPIHRIAWSWWGRPEKYKIYYRKYISKCGENIENIALELCISTKIKICQI